MKNEINNTVPASQQQNKKLTKIYTKDPRIYWTESNNTSSFPSFLISTVIFIFSVFAASANCERVFSRMSYMISGLLEGRESLQIMQTSGLRYPIKFLRNVGFLTCAMSGRSRKRSFLRFNFMLSCSFFNSNQCKENVLNLNVFSVKKDV